VEYGTAPSIETLAANANVVALLSDPAKGGPELMAMLTFGSEEKRTLLGCALARGNERLIRLLLAACRCHPLGNTGLEPWKNCAGVLMRVVAGHQFRLDGWVT
jgi:hypothetical protein